MAVDITGASECYKENTDLLIDQVLHPTSAVLFNMQTGIKSSDFLHVVQTTVTLGDCACSCTGDDTEHTFIDREIEVGCIKVEDTICSFDFNKIWIEKEIRIEAGRESLGSVGEILATTFAAAVAARNEVLIWQGDTTSGDANLNKTNGIIKIMTDDADVTKLDLTAQTDAQAILRLAVAAMPESAYERGRDTAEGPLPVILVSSNFFRQLTLQQAEESANICCPSNTIELFRGLYSFMYLTTGVRVIAVPGMNGSGSIIVGSLHDLYLGTDLENGYEEVAGWWSEDCDSWRHRIKYRIGTQIAFPEDMVLITYTDTTATPFGLNTRKSNAPTGLTNEQKIVNAKAAYLSAYDTKQMETEDAPTSVKSSNTRAVNNAIKALELLGVDPASVIESRVN